MKNKNHIIMLALVILLGNIIWEIWPDPANTQIIKYNVPDGLGSDLQSCDDLASYWAGSWNLRYPSRIDANQQAEILLIYKPAAQGDASDHQVGCGLVIDTFLEMSRHEIEPGGQYITPYSNFETVQFKWTVSPSAQEISGVLWVAVNVHTADDQLTRIPMFALPIEIQKISFLSVPITTIRVLFIIASLLVITICVILRMRKSQ